MSECKHTGRAFFAVGSNWDVRILRCLRCMKLLPFGPSNDRGARVKIEIRAAGIAARAVGDWPDFDEGFGVQIGWEEHQIGSTRYLVTLDRWAGWLAREIAMHPSSSAAVDE